MASSENSKRYRQRLRMRAFDAIGWACIWCGGAFGEPLEAAHVKTTGLNGQGRGLDRRYRDVLAHPECYRPMCRRCHRLYDQLRALEGAVECKDEPIPF